MPPRKTRSRLWMALGTAAVLGCRAAAPRVPLDPIPFADAAAVVNRNVARVEGTLRAVGAVDGHFRTPEGGRRSYHLDGVLFFLAPSFVRFDLKALSERQFLFGSNTEQYWFYSKQDDSFRCGHHGLDADLPAEMPVRPDQLIAALGFQAIPEEPSVRDTFCVQRVEPEHQQILFILRDGDGRPSVEKEYWLDRFPPRLVRRVVFRDPEGVVSMESTLDDYRVLSPGGPLLPHSMSADWPGAGSTMRFHVRRWTLEPSVTASGPQFAAPVQCHDR